MKIPLSWLQEYVDIALPSADLADRLTMAGTEVKGIQVIGDGWENIVIGQIVAINPHPNADRLRLATIDLGTEQHTVVCGAPNLNLGDRVAFAYVGAQLIDGHSGEVFRLKPAKIRGVVSKGMACSEKELGISDSHEGIMVLPAEAPIGTPLAEYLGDTILDADITPNRPDCLCILGIAREAAALTRQSLPLPEVKYEQAGPPIDQQVSVEIAAPDLCPRYCASLITGIKVTESPLWMQQRLLKCGMRPINNIVDITNYVMLEYGQPLHAFDYQKIKGGKIIVRRPASGETITTLDGEERRLSQDMLVIADKEGPVAIAGVMGGAASEVASETTSILLEAANFNPANIHYTGRVLGMPSEACMRFERGIHPELVMPAIERATQLIVQLAGGEAARGLVDVYPGKAEPEPITLTTDQVKRLLGVDFSLDQIVGALTSLGFDCQEGASEVRAIAPYWRSDIHVAVDLIEEVARIMGYDNIPTTMLSQPIPRQTPDPILSLKQGVRDSIAGYGFQEVLTYSLTSLEMLNKLLPESGSVEPLPLRVANPMTLEQEYLRPDLRANLLAALSANMRYEEDSIKLFELGKVYLPKEKDLPDEPEMMCGVASGSRWGRSWHGGDDAFDFYDAKGAVEGLLSQLNIEASFVEGKDQSLHPLRQAAIVAGSNQLGVVGELHPKVSLAFEIPEAVYLFEINLSALLPFTLGHRIFQPVSPFPTMVRDIALVVDVGVTHQQATDIIRGFPLVKQVAIFDVYSGGQVASGKKSLAYSITFQSSTHTLTDEEVNKVQQKILDELSRELGADLRA
ncbi:MAG: phenylalanine--tRNA ligase subunit beta [Dehalococcoidales bacterium]|nr:phenylalanine--tRNA ligase subunit beta [Dehalococcoidales bacterium]